MTNGFIRPGNQIFLDFHRRYPIDACIESCKVKDEAYWGDNPVDAANVRPDIQIEISDLTVLYQSVVPAAGFLASLLRNPSLYYVDVSRAHSSLSGRGVRLSLSLSFAGPEVEP